MSPLLITAALVAIAVVAAIWMLASRRRRLAGTQVLIGEAMKRLGITPADAEAAGLEPALLAATQRCAGCTDTAQCRSRLGAFTGPPIPDQCPSHTLFAHIAAHKAAQPRPAVMPEANLEYGSPPAAASRP